MLLPSGFSFTQSNLQDYLDCRKRFLLRYVEKIDWPALESEPVLDFEKQINDGKRFHRLIQQHMLGIPSERLEQEVMGEPDLLRWFKNYLQCTFIIDLPRLRKVEHQMAVPYPPYRLSSIIDLLAWDASGTCMIIDWKTALKRPSRKYSEARIQTHLYPYIVLRGLNAGHFPGLDTASSIDFVYWYSEFPDNPEIFPYSPSIDGEFSTRLRSIIHAISTSDSKDFSMTPDDRRCQFCCYRSYCGRGTVAGDFQTAPDPEFIPDSMLNTEDSLDTDASWDRQNML